MVLGAVKFLPNCILSRYGDGLYNELITWRNKVIRAQALETCVSFRYNQDIKPKNFNKCPKNRPFTKSP